MNPPPAHNSCVFVKLSSKITLFLRYPRRGKKLQLRAFLDLKLVQQKQRKQLHPRRGKKIAILLVPLRYILFGVVLRIYHVFWRRFGSGFEVRIIYFVPEHSPASYFRKMSRAMLQFQEFAKNTIFVIGMLVPRHIYFGTCFPPFPVVFAINRTLS